MQQKRLNISAVKQAIDTMFTEIVKKTDIKETDKILPTTIVLDGVEYVYRLIDSSNEIELKKLAEARVELSCKQRPKNSKAEIIKVETEKAKEYQTYFPSYPFNNENYYFALQRWIDVLQNLLPKQQETDNPDVKKKELHNNIFKGNAFEVFEKYHTNKKLTENCRTDLNLLFQLFHGDNLFVETVELKHYIKWLNKTYGYGLSELKKVNKNSNPNIQRTNDYNEYKRTTLK